MNTKTLPTLLLQTLFLGALIALALGLNYLSAWTGPTASAPNGNVDAPLNIGTTAQVKDGNLSVGRSTNTATDFGIISYGKVRSTVGGFQFPDGTVQATAAVGAGTLQSAMVTGSGWAGSAGWGSFSVTCPAGYVVSGCNPTTSNTYLDSTNQTQCLFRITGSNQSGTGFATCLRIQ